MKDLLKDESPLCLKLIAHLKATMLYERYKDEGLKIPWSVITESQETYGNLPVELQFYLEEV